MKKAAQEEKMRRPRQSKDEMPPPASLQGSSGENESYFCFFYFEATVMPYRSTMFYFSNSLNGLRKERSSHG